MWEAIFGLALDVGASLVAMLPTIGCDLAGVPTFDLGPMGYYINVPALATAAGVMVGFEGLMLGYRALVVIRNWLPFW